MSGPSSQTLVFSGHIPPPLQLPPCQPWAEEGALHFYAISLNGHFLPGEVFPGDFLHVCRDEASVHREQHKQELYISQWRKIKPLPETDYDEDGWQQGCRNLSLRSAYRGSIGRQPGVIH